MMSNDQQPLMTDEQYCKDQGIPIEWANTPKIKEHYLKVSEDKDADQQYRMWLAQNGLLNKVEDTA